MLYLTGCSLWHAFDQYLFLTFKGLILSLTSYLSNQVLHTFTVTVIHLIRYGADAFNFISVSLLNSYYTIY